jgi:hypothetical protein
MEIVTCGVWMGVWGWEGSSESAEQTLDEGHGFSCADNVQVEDGFSRCDTHFKRLRGEVSLSGEKFAANDETRTSGAKAQFSFGLLRPD